jgi:hypothetical protein
MDSRLLDPTQWDLIARAMISVYAFAGLGLCGALAFLLAYTAVPSPAAESAHSPGRAWRLVLHPLGILSLALGAVALGNGLALAVRVLSSIYPRFLI